MEVAFCLDPYVLRVVQTMEPGSAQQGDDVYAVRSDVDWLAEFQVCKDCVMNIMRKYVF